MSTFANQRGLAKETVFALDKGSDPGLALIVSNDSAFQKECLSQ